MSTPMDDFRSTLSRLKNDAGCSADSVREVLVSLIQDQQMRIVATQPASKLRNRWIVYVGVLFAAFAVIALELRGTVAGYLTSQRCILSNNVMFMEMTRPPVNCSICTLLNGSAAVAKSLTPSDFLLNYAYTGVPILVKGGAKNWTAMHTFSFEYFKKLYNDTPGALRSIENECQFFPYQTEFETMKDVFEMSVARSLLGKDQKQWYVGWSNCHPVIAEELRRHYSRPLFLPEDSESSSLDWIFMGGFGGGAYLHIDYVGRPSWQAMISGAKTWTLMPSPECQHLCLPINVPMETGDIFVIDTNIWYHTTYIHPGNISITIGSEYD